MNDLESVDFGHARRGSKTVLLLNGMYVRTHYDCLG